MSGEFVLAAVGRWLLLVELESGGRPEEDVDEDPPAERKWAGREDEKP